MGDEALPAAAIATPATMQSLIPFPGKLGMDGNIATNWKQEGHDGPVSLHCFFFAKKKRVMRMG
ncbi:hypothetical protein DPMN_010236 [Dreissena polymorpha]|uniref:Uncharacterized protein n=1 Tax=Dreissena polymorpha TaxID=45954 RepID=A0A9D4MZK8_DREPO|nr:hypothetical protein DPMN_010236 [Dreissena polymorpha]